MPNVSESTLEKLRSQIGDAFSAGIHNFGYGTISRWLIRPGMEFASPLIWWGDVTKTRRDSYGGGPHEGIDFALAQKSGSQRIQAGLEGLHVPALLDGAALWRFDDLVGDTLIAASDFCEQGKRFIIQYSHIELENIQIGDAIKQGDFVGTIKRSLNPKSITASHLHISTALIDEELLERTDHSVSFKNWLEWDQEGKLVYLDPLSLVSSEVKIDRFLIGDEAKSPLAQIVSTGASKEDRIQLRRLIARNFPGIQSISAKTNDEAEALLAPQSMLVSSRDESWEIKATDSIEILNNTALAGEGFPDLVTTISDIEQVNFTHR